MDYHILREIADSWVLLVLVIFFIGAVIWVFRPGSRSSQRDASEIPFRHDDKPAADDGEQDK